MAVTTAAAAGTRMISARSRPTRARAAADHAEAKKMSRLMLASSRKSTLSAKRDTDPIRRATRNSTPKYARLSSATTSTARRRLRSIRPA
ncbi:hypothetical protein [Naasia aerilata]|uniref:hypothetical protein n=1 Tax=Naasia aerilata TaxID=1162966 RepID=UPI00257468DD|nr:hypothetical protein [Naasia aerilata]